jgi:hypothetical protein
MGRYWSDQPAVIENTIRLLHVHVGNGTVVAVYREPAGPLYYVTVGNLFHSQTVRCDTVDLAFVVVQLASDGKTQRELPKGMAIVEPTELERLASGTAS